MRVIIKNWSKISLLNMAEWAGKDIISCIYNIGILKAEQYSSQSVFWVQQSCIRHCKLCSNLGCWHLRVAVRSWVAFVFMEAIVFSSSGLLCAKFACHYLHRLYHPDSLACQCSIFHGHRIDQNTYTPLHSTDVHFYTMFAEGQQYPAQGRHQSFPQHQSPMVQQ